MNLSRNEQCLLEYLIKVKVNINSIIFLKENMELNNELWYKIITEIIKNDNYHTKKRMPRIPLKYLKYSDEANPLQLKKIKIDSFENIDFKGDFNFDDFPIWELGDCYKNALKFNLLVKNTKYIEGFVVYRDTEDTHIVPHAWTKINNIYIDPTYEFCKECDQKNYHYFLYLEVYTVLD